MSKATLAIYHNNAFDTVALLDDGQIAGSWHDSKRIAEALTGTCPADWSANDSVWEPTDCDTLVAEVTSNGRVVECDPRAWADACERYEIEIA